MKVADRPIPRTSKRNAPDIAPGAARGGTGGERGGRGGRRGGFSGNDGGTNLIQLLRADVTYQYRDG